MNKLSSKKIFFPLAKTDQVRETLKPSCRENLLVENSPFSTFGAPFKGFHMVKAVSHIAVGYFCQQPKITVYMENYEKD